MVLPSVQTALATLKAHGHDTNLMCMADGVCVCMQERGNANAQAWSSAIQSAVGEGWQRLGLRQLSGMLVLVYIRSALLVKLHLLLPLSNGGSIYAGTSYWRPCSVV